LGISLAGKVAWVTGASGGLGGAIVQAFIDADCTVVSTDVADKPALEHERVFHKKIDVTQQRDLDAVVEFCRDELGGLDILVNNAGINGREDLFDVTRELWWKILDVNLGGYFFCSQTAARLMRDQGRGGAIVNTLSIGTERIGRCTAPYYASKGGIESLTYTLAARLAPFKIRVNAMSPGTMVTNMSRADFEQPGAKEHMIARTPLGRIGEPSDYASGILFLASDAADFITGSILRIDGGKTIIS